MTIYEPDFGVESGIWCSIGAYGRNPKILKCEAANHLPNSVTVFESA
jgi:hypothetical protein